MEPFYTRTLQVAHKHTQRYFEPNHSSPKRRHFISFAQAQFVSAQEENSRLKNEFLDWPISRPWLKPKLKPEHQPSH
jgi:hypothetical protein